MARFVPENWRRILGWAGGGLLAFVIVFAVLWRTGLLDGPVLWAGGQVSGYGISCSRIDGDLLDSFTCHDLALSDDDGVFLTAKAFSLDWHVLALLSNTADLRKIALSDAKLSRMPVDNSPPSPDSGFLPSIDIRVGSLAIARLRMPPQSGRELCLNAGANGQIGPGGFAAAMKAVRCEAGAGQIVFAGRYNKATRALTLNAKGDDDGALIAFFAGEPGVGQTTFALSGDGTTDAFNGRVTAVAEKLGRIALTFVANDTPATHLEGTFALAPEIAPDWAPNEDGRISADVAGTSDGGIVLRRARLSWGAFQANAALTQAGNGALSGTVAADVKQAMQISGVSLSALSLRANVSGSASQPVVTGNLRATDLQSGDMGVGTLEAAFDLRMDQVQQSLLMTLKGSAHDAAGPGYVRGLLGQAVTFEGKVSQITPRHNASLQLHAVGQGADLDASIGMEGGTGSGTVTLDIPDFAKAGAGFAGTMTARIDINRFTETGDLNADLDITGSKIGKGGAGTALGPTPKISAHVDALQGALSVDDVMIDTAAVAASGGATIARDGAIDGTFQTTRGDAAKLSELVGSKLAGAFNLIVHASGKRDAAKVTLSLKSAKLTVDGKPVTSPSLTIAANQAGDQWTGDFSLDAGTPGGALALSAKAQTRPNGFLLAIRKGAIGPAKISGQMEQNKSRLLGHIALTGDVLAPVGAITGDTLHGTGTIAFDGTDSGFRVVADLKNVAAAPFNDATLHAEFRAADLDSPVTATLAVRDGKNALDASLTAKTGKETLVTLSSFKGAWSGNTIALAGPATLTLSGSRYTLDRTRFDIGTGNLTVAAKGDAGNLSASASLVDLPAGVAASFMGLGKAKGTINLDLSADIGPRTSSASINLSGKGLAFVGLNKKVTPTDVSMTGRWDGRTFALNGNMTGFSEKPATLTAQLPVVRENGGVMPALAKSGPVSAQLRADVRAERLMAILPVAEHQLSGDFNASLDVSGDISGPLLSGKISVANGKYENLEYGTRLEKLNAAITAQGSKTATLRFDATDGGSGHVSANGSISIGAPSPGDTRRIFGSAELTLKNAYVTRQDDMLVRTDGTLKLDLPHGAVPSVTGKFQTDEVRIDLGARFPPDIPQIPVKEINGPVEQASPAPSGPSPFADTKLDISVHMPNNVFVTGHGLDAEWRGNVKVGGTLSTPDIDARLELARGQMSLIGKTFKLTEGKVVSDKNAKGGATIAAKGEYETTDLTVNISVDGPVAQPEITWTSTPSLPKDEILSRMLFGKSTPKLSAVEAFQLAQMSGQLSFLGGGSGGVMGFARRLTGLDVLRFDTPADSTSGTALTVGKNLTDRLYVGATQGTKAAQGTAQVEYRITKHITADAEAGANSDNAVGVSWKWDY